MRLKFGQEFSRDASRRCTLCYFFNEEGESFEVGISDVLAKNLWRLSQEKVQRILPAIGFEHLLRQLQKNAGGVEPVILTSKNTSNKRPAELPEYYCLDLRRSESGVSCSKFGTLQDSVGCKLSENCRSCWQYEVKT